MQKREINKNVRWALIIVIICALLATAFFLYQKITSPEVEEKKTTHYSYMNMLNVNYEVTLKPNNLFEKTTQGEKQIYLSNLVDTIKTSYNYQFSGDLEAKIKGDYEIIAVVEGYIIQNQDRISIWKKQFILVPKTVFDTKGTKNTIARDVVLKLQSYRDFANTIKEETKIDSDITLTALMNVNTESTTDKGTIRDSVSSSIDFPLKGNYFEISKKDEDKPGAIQEIIQVPVSNCHIIVLCGIVLFVFLIALVFLVFYTVNRHDDPYIKKVKKIFKKYGTRMAAVNTEIILKGENYLVKSFEDLVTFSDETGKPIVYRYSEEPREITVFYIFEEKCTWFFVLEN